MKEKQRALLGGTFPPVFFKVQTRKWLIPLVLVFGSQPIRAVLPSGRIWSLGKKLLLCAILLHKRPLILLLDMSWPSGCLWAEVIMGVVGCGWGVPDDLCSGKMKVEIGNVAEHGFPSLVSGKILGGWSWLLAWARGVRLRPPLPWLFTRRPAFIAGILLLLPWDPGCIRELHPQLFLSGRVLGAVAGCPVDRKEWPVVVKTSSKVFSIQNVLMFFFPFFVFFWGGGPNFDL